MHVSHNCKQENEMYKKVGTSLAFFTLKNCRTVLKVSCTILFENQSLLRLIDVSGLLGYHRCIFRALHIFPQLAKRATGVVHVMLNGTRQHFVDKQIFPSFMDDRLGYMFLRKVIRNFSFIKLTGQSD